MVLYNNIAPSIIFDAINAVGDTKFIFVWLITTNSKNVKKIKEKCTVPSKMEFDCAMNFFQHQEC